MHIEIELLKKGRNSNTSSTPSSQDFAGRKIHNSRKKSSRKSGGQKGHKGTSLKMSKTPDEIIKHSPNYCTACGKELFDAEMKIYQKRQEVVMPPIIPKTIEHRTYKCTCSHCGEETISDMPPNLTANIQYGESIHALVTYLSVFQLIPAKRLKQFVRDYANLNMSEGTIFNILKAMSNKALPVYEEIKEKLQKSPFVGSDETGIHINKAKAWLWIFQNNALTYIRASLSRGFQTILDTFSDGFPVSVYVSDSLPAQLKVNSLAKQLCLAHLSRELNKFEEVFNSEWATEMKSLFKKSIDLKRQMQITGGFSKNPQVEELEKELNKLLQVDESKKHTKIKAFIKRLRKNRDAIFTFLYYKEVPPDNNGSERGIRNAKIKMKISNQFKSFDFAQHYAVIRSVIDTAIKNGQDVFNALNVLASQKLITAE